jgi:hypothetical protein
MCAVELHADGVHQASTLNVSGKKANIGQALLPLGRAVTRNMLLTYVLASAHDISPNHTYTAKPFTAN